MEVVRILAVDDHEMTTMGYKYILKAKNLKTLKFELRLQQVLIWVKKRSNFQLDL